MTNFSIDIDSTKMAKKLRALANHAVQLADEFDEIDKECDCGANNFNEDLSNNKRKCMDCGEEYIISREWPTRLEGSI